MIHFQIAYIDPGSGSILLQMVIGGFLGAVYVGRKAAYQAWSSIRNVTNSSKRSNKAVSPVGEK